MLCVVLNETKKDLYIVRHIIDTNGEEDLSKIKQEYYNTFHKLEKDEFFLCRNNKEVNEVLLQHKTGPLLPVYDNRMYKLRIYKKSGINKGNLVMRKFSIQNLKWIKDTVSYLMLTKIL